jgi:uncharacterized protein (DUF2141 family)
LDFHFLEVSFSLENYIGGLNMRKKLLKYIGLMLTLSSGLFAVELQVNVMGIEESKGSIRVALFEDTQKELFPDISSKIKTLTIEAKSNSINKVFFDKIKSGYYAVIVLHDVNDNQKIDTFLGIPTEPLGTSGEFTRSKPTYEKSKFFIEDNKTKVIEIKVH